MTGTCCDRHIVEQIEVYGLVVPRLTDNHDGVLHIAPCNQEVGGEAGNPGSGSCRRKQIAS